ncbi:MAG: transglutaminase domain-containing protein [Eubacterium sp.]
MKKTNKKLISLLLSVVMFFSVFSSAGNVLAEDLVFSQTTISSENAPYIDENGVYWRKTTDEEGTVKYIDFKTDYDEMIKYFQNEMLGRAPSIEYRFATNDKEYQYRYESQDDYADAQKVANSLFNRAFRDIFTKTYGDSKAELGDYLFRSIDYGEYSYGCNVFTSGMDTPAEGNDRYFTFRIELINLKYYTTVSQEKEIADFAKQFSSVYLDEAETDYEKVKTIYDFVVRNTIYDQEVYEGLYPYSSERYYRAHSAYGALFGNLTDEEYDLTDKKSVTGESIIKKPNQGKAVCEGFSMLFYYLCQYNGIDCRIVDGDYDKNYVDFTDPHEWNYVYLDDASGDGYKWFQIDTTFASQKSYKEIDSNCYDYFLCGTENINFGYYNHQQAYKSDDVDIRPQLYNWYSEENIASAMDYKYPIVDLSTIVSLDENDVIIQRATLYDGQTGEKYAFIRANEDGTALIRANEDGSITYENVEGFGYNGYMSSFRMFVPYLFDKEYNSDTIRAENCGTYDISIHGSGESTFDYSFKIVPMDMSVSANYDEIIIQTQGNYTGNELVPQVEIVDGYGNNLERGRDFDLTVSQNGSEVKIIEMGDYQIVVDFKGNYCGTYPFVFNVGKINLNQIDYEVAPIPYYPQGMLNSKGYNDMADYIEKTLSDTSSTVGTKTIYAGVDYSVSVDSAKQKIKLTAIPTSKLVVKDSFINIDYELSKFDMTQLNGKIADNSTSYTYTGSAVKPSKFNWLDENFTRGVDYEIVSYSNNVNVGTAYVTIRGIGNCTGTAKMQYRVCPTSITKATITPSTKANTVSYTVTYKGKALVKGTDYNESITITSNGYKITLTGKGNFNGTVTMNVVSTISAPSSSGNTIKLSATAYTYDGNLKKPTVSLVNKNGKTVSTYFYTVKYSNNRYVGTAKVTVTFRNGYAGTMTKSFAIKPKATSISSVSALSKGFKVTWKKQTVQTTGYQIQYSTSSKFTKSKTVTVSKNTTTSKSVTNLTKKKKYYVRIRTYKKVSGKVYYSSWSSAKAVTTK